MIYKKWHTIQFIWEIEYLYMVTDLCLLLKIWVENISKNISKILSSKYSHKLLDHAKKSATDALQIWLSIKLLIELQKS